MGQDGKGFVRDFWLFFTLTPFPLKIKNKLAIFHHSFSSYSDLLAVSFLVLAAAAMQPVQEDHFDLIVLMRKVET
jgi:hypothetical protein